MATFDPFDQAPDYEPDARTPADQDTRWETRPGNISARLRTAGTPRTTRDWENLMRAPAGR